MCSDLAAASAQAHTRPRQARTSARTPARTALVVAAAVAAAAAADMAPGSAAAAVQPTDAELPRLEEQTALTLGARKLRVGLLALDYGITDRVTIGTDPPAWAARAALPLLIPNLHVKVVAMQTDRFWLSARIAAYYVMYGRGEAESASMLALPLSAFASVNVLPRLWLHGELCYILAQAFGSANVSQADAEGAISASAVQAGGTIELRVSRLVAILLRGRYQFYTGPLVFEGSARPDQYTTIDVDGRLEPRVEHPYSAVAGVALLWQHVRLMVGGGYGYFFVPGMNMAIPSRGFVPDGSLSVVF